MAGRDCRQGLSAPGRLVGDSVSVSDGDGGNTSPSATVEVVDLVATLYVQKDLVDIGVTTVEAENRSFMQT
jgi:hypothetical protein